jgi:hypothetical protein
MKKALFLSLVFFIITNPASASYRHITCAMVRSFVAERGFAEARAEALAAGMTRLQERLAMWCLRSARG